MYGINLSASIKKVPSSRSHITLFTSIIAMGILSHTLTKCGGLNNVSWTMSSLVVVMVIYYVPTYNSSKGFLQRTGNDYPLIQYISKLQLCMVTWSIHSNRQRMSTNVKLWTYPCIGAARDCHQFLNWSDSNDIMVLMSWWLVYHHCDTMRVIQVILRKE